MSEFDRERAREKAPDLSHLKDEVDEKNTEHIDQMRLAPGDRVGDLGDQTEDETGDETGDEAEGEAANEAAPPSGRRV